MGRIAATVLVVLAFALIFGNSATHASPTSCSTVNIGGDTTLVNGFGEMVGGEALGEVFVASDTLIHSITVWRWAGQDTSFIGVKIYLTETDASGRPLVNSILLNGPVMIIPYGDGIHATPFEFVFDPPLALPHSGRFCLAIQAAPCDATLRIDASSQQPYGDGAAWVFGRSGCTLRPFPQEFPSLDIMFKVEFCDSSTPVRERTWGAVKNAYRR